jgi:hypothetical protein
LQPPNGDGWLGEVHPKRAPSIWLEPGDWVLSILGRKGVAEVGAWFVVAQAFREQSVPQKRNPCYKSFLGIASQRIARRADEDGAKGYNPMGRGIAGGFFYFFARNPLKRLDSEK